MNNEELLEYAESRREFEYKDVDGSIFIQLLDLYRSLEREKKEVEEELESLQNGFKGMC